MSTPLFLTMPLVAIADQWAGNRASALYWARLDGLITEREYEDAYKLTRRLHAAAVGRLS